MEWQLEKAQKMPKIKQGLSCWPGITSTLSKKETQKPMDLDHLGSTSMNLFLPKELRLAI